MEELYKRVDKYSIVEDDIRTVAQTVMITNQSDEGNKPYRKKLSKSKEGQGGDRKRSRDQSQKMKELPQFTPLNISYEKLLPITSDLLEFKWSALILWRPPYPTRPVWADPNRVRDATKITQ